MSSSDVKLVAFIVVTWLHLRTKQLIMSNNVWNDAAGNKVGRAFKLCMYFLFYYFLCYLVALLNISFKFKVTQIKNEIKNSGKKINVQFCCEIKFLLIDKFSSLPVNSWQLQLRKLTAYIIHNYVDYTF